MVCLGQNLFWGNKSAPPSGSHLYTQWGVAYWMSGHCSHSTPDKLQLWKFGLPTLGGYHSLVCPHTLPNMLLFLCCLAFPFLSPSEPCLHVVSITSQSNIINPFRHIKYSALRPVVRSHYTSSIHSLSVFESMPHYIQTVLSPDNGPMLLLHTLSRPYFLPLVECTKVGLTHSFGK